MTLLVGIWCEGGAVIAADRQASHGSFGQQTVGHETPKIHKLNDTVLFAASGPVGMGQHLAHVFSANSPGIAGNNYFDVLPSMQGLVRGTLAPALAMAGQVQNLVGPAAAQSDAICNSLLAAVFKDGLKLIEISPQGGFEFLTHDVPYVCIGSGKANADPFVRFLWSVFWSKRPPSVQGAVLTAYWTVKAAIEAQTQGVGYSPDVAILSADTSGIYAAKVYSPDELQEHDGFIEQAHEALRQTRDTILDRSLGQPASQLADPLPVMEELRHSGNIPITNL